MQDVVLAALLVVDDELYGDARAVRPIGERRRAPVADHVARIDFAVRHLSLSPARALSRRPSRRYDRTVPCSSPRRAQRHDPPGRRGDLSLVVARFNQFKAFLPRRFREAVVERDQVERRGTSFGGDKGGRKLKRVSRP